MSHSHWGDAEERRSLLGAAGSRRIEVIARSLDIRLPSPECFVELTILGAASLVPAFARLDEKERAELVAAVSDETDRVAEQFRDGDGLRFPMSTHIAVALLG